MTRLRLFLSVPFSSRVNESGNVESMFRAEVERLIGGLRVYGNHVFCALEYDNWRIQSVADPVDELKKDFAEIDACDRVVVLLEERVSSGIQLENGYAYAKEKEIEVYQIGKPTWSNSAFSRLNGHEIIPVSDIKDFVDTVLKAYKPRS